MNQKNPMIAFLLAFFPGAGLMYLKKLRGLFYTFSIFCIIGLALFAGVLGGDVFLFLGLFGVGILYFINFIDTVITAAKIYQVKNSDDNEVKLEPPNEQSERFYTIILSIIPGLGHFQLGLVNRGITLLVGFIG